MLFSPNFDITRSGRLRIILYQIVAMVQSRLYATHKLVRLTYRSLLLWIAMIAFLLNKYFCKLLLTSGSSLSHVNADAVTIVLLFG